MLEAHRQRLVRLQRNRVFQLRPNQADDRPGSDAVSAQGNRISERQAHHHDRHRQDGDLVEAGSRGGSGSRSEKEEEK